ncbi:MAG: choice-of-anchor D domain-containing protein [Candidatus Cloacimonetes bacterium]|nr:choice-of-anchor D domain-containing protein [Candidatus Cloacimonadota bacterium]
MNRTNKNNRNNGFNAIEKTNITLQGNATTGYNGIEHQREIRYSNSKLQSLNQSRPQYSKKENIMKNIKKIFLTILLVLAIGTMFAQGTPGLAYTLINNGTAYEVSRGTATDTDVVIPATHSGLPVIRIATSGFQSFNNMTSIHIPNSVTYIGAWAFSNCTSLTSVSIGSGVTNYGGSVFYGSPVTHFYVNSVVAVGLLSESSTLTSVIIGNSVTSIGSSAFYGCTGLTSIDIPDSVTSIGQQAFYGCTSLTSIDIPNSVTSIGQQAFWGCTSLISIDIPNSVTSIDGHAFRNCTSLASVSIGNGVTSVGSTVFSGSPVTHFSVNSDAAVGLLSGSSTLTSVIFGDSVTSIGDWAFTDCTGLTSIDIPNSVTSIGQQAFWGCTGLTSIDIPDSVVSIGLSAFSYCTSLTSVSIGNGVASVGGSVFSGSPVTHFSVNSNEAVDLFRGSNTLTSVIIGDSVTYIRSLAFYNCTSLTSVSIGSGVTSNYGSTFYGSPVTHFYVNSNAAVGFFSGSSTLTSVIIGDSVTYIRSFAFQNCTSLTSINIPNSVTSIEGSAFSSCSGLTSIDIPNSVTSIGNSAFSNCTSLTSIDIPNSVTSIESGAFSNCTSLTSIDIPNSVTSIGSRAFSNCTSLTSIYIPNSVSSIGFFAFNSCTNLTIYAEATSQPSGWDTSWNPDNRPVIWGAVKAIIPATNLTTNIFGNDVTLNWNNALGFALQGYNIYRGATLLTTSPIIETNYVASDTPSGMHVFGVRAVYPNGESEAVESTIYVGFNPPAELVATDGVNSVNLSWIAPSIQNTVFLAGYRVERRAGQGSWNTVVDNLSLTPTAWTDNTVTIGTVYEYRVIAKYTNPIYESVPSNEVSITIIEPVLLNFTLIDNGTAYEVSRGTANDTHIEIPASYNGLPVTQIADWGFSYFTTMTSITIPNSVTSIGNYAFWGCTGLTSIDIPNSVTSIGNEAFRNCTGLTSIDIPDSVTSIGNYAFWGCTGLTSIDIPDSVTSIGDYAFRYCSGLTSIDIPNSVTSIGNEAFYNCTSLTSVSIGNGVTSVGYSVFSGSPVTHFSVNSNVAVRLLSGSNTLTSVIIGNSVTSIGNNAFGGCTNLTSIDIPDSVTSIDNNAFSGCTSLTSIDIPNSVTSIGDYAFRGCTSLTSIDIPNSVTSIGNWAFTGCTGLTSIYIPDSVTSIGYQAFSGCTGLTSIYIPISVTSIGSNAFSDCNSLTIYAEATSQPSGWHSIWNPNNRPVIWGAVSAIVPPTNLTTNVFGNDVTLNWDNALGFALQGYRVYRGSTELTTTPIIGTNYVASDTPSGMHVFGVRAVYPNGESEAVETTAFVGFNPPTELVATDGLNSVNLLWIAPSVQNTVFLAGYRVERRVGQGSWNTIVDNLSLTPTAWTDNTVTVGTDYEYRVIAKYTNPIFESDPSNEVSITIIEPVPNHAINPDPMDGAIDVPLTQVLSWEADANGSTPTGYKFYFGTTNPPEYVMSIETIDTTSWNPSTAGMPLLHGRITYYWQVVPFNDTGDAVDCPIWSFTTIPGPPIFYINTQSIDFENVFLHELSHSIDFVIYNIGESDLLISDMNVTGDDDFTIKQINESLIDFPWTTPAQEFVYFTVIFAPSSIGEKSAIITIFHNAEDSPHTINLSGTGIDNGFNIYPTAHDFGEILVGETSDIETFTITNHGIGPLIVSSIAISSVTDFDVTAIGLPWTIQVGEYKTFTASFSPMLSFGYVATTCVIQHNSFGSPFSIYLSGTGIIPEFHPPQNLTANEGNNVVNLSWDAPLPGSDGTLSGYRVYRNETAITGTISGLIYSDTSVTNGITYSYNVRAIYTNPTGESELSNTVEATPFFNAAPTDVVAEVVGSDILVSWEFGGRSIGMENGEWKMENDDSRMDNGQWIMDNENQSEQRNRRENRNRIIEESDNSRDSRAFLHFRVYRDGVFLSQATGMSYIDEEPAADISYVYSVRAVYTTGQSEAVEADPVFVPLFSPVTNLQAEVFETVITLSWSAPATQNHGNVSGYKVERRIGVSGNWNLIQNITNSWTLTYNDTDFEYETEYYYQVIAVYVNPEGESVPSNVVSVTPIIPPPVFEISPLSHNFGDILVGETSVVQSFIITNTGGSPLMIESITIDEEVSRLLRGEFQGRNLATTGGDLASTGERGFLNQNEFNLDFDVAPPWNIPAGSNRTFTVSFSPLTAGVKSAEIQIIDNLGRGWGMGNEILHFVQNDRMGGQNERVGDRNDRVGVQNDRVGDRNDRMDFQNDRVRSQNDRAGDRNDRNDRSSEQNNRSTSRNSRDIHTVALTGNGVSAIFNPPLNLSATAGNSIVNLIWQAPTSGSTGTLSGYRVYRNGTAITGTISGLTYQDTGLANDTTYNYNVRAIYINPIGESELSNTASATPQAPQPIFSINPLAHNFGDILVGETSAVQNFVITNTGGSDLIISGINRIGATEFNISHTTLPITITPNGTASISVTFSPMSEGGYGAFLNITHNAVGSPSSISLSGAGVVPGININPISHNFGNIFIGETSPVQTFTVSNTGGAALNVFSITLSGLNQSEFNLNTSGLPWTIDASGNMTFTVSFSPMSENIKTANINITHNGDNSPSQVTLTGVGVMPLPEIDISHISYDFGEIVVGDISDSQTFIITNTGDAPLVIASITIDEEVSRLLRGEVHRSDLATTGEYLRNVDDRDFRNQNEFNLNVTGLPWTINAGENQTFSVSFAPLSEGDKTANVIIEHNASGSPHTIILTGIGAPIPPPIFTLNRTSIDFGSVFIEEISEPQNIVITNTGGLPLVISEIIKTENNPPMPNESEFFITSDTLPITITAGTTTTINVTFSPMSTDLKTANISFIHNASGSPNNVSLAGVGILDDGFYINPTAHDFGELIVGDISDSQTFAITNHGGSPLVIASITLDEEVSRLLRGEFHRSDLATTGERLLRGEFQGSDLAMTGGEPRNDDRSDLATTGNFNLIATGLPWTIQVGNNRTFTVTFSPVTEGFKTATLNIEHNSAGSPFTVNLSGTGLIPVPSPAINPEPGDGAINVPINQVLSWEVDLSGMRDVGNESNAERIHAFPTGYKIHFGTTNPPPMIDNNWTTTTYVPTGMSALQNGTTYYWQIVPFNETGDAVDCPIWSFTTIPAIPDIAINPSSHNFGDVLVGTISNTQDFIISNTGNGDLVISNISPIGASEFNYTHASLPITIGSGASSTLSVTFSPSSEGSFGALVNITHNAAGSPNTITLSGAGVLPIFSINPISFDFGNIVVGAVSDQTFTISNTGSAPLVIESISLDEEVSRLLREIASGGDFLGEPRNDDRSDLAKTGERLLRGEFHRSDLATTGDFSLIATGLPWTINVGGNQTFTVSFSPTSEGHKTASLNISHSANGSPQNVALTGVGTTPLPPAFQINPLSHDFGNIYVGESSSSQSFVITNTGGSPLIISSINRSGTNTNEFIQTHNTLPIIINPSNTTAINVIFSPLSEGAKSAVLNISHNGSDSPGSVALAGLGVIPPPPVFVINPLSFDFGEVFVGDASDSQIFTITNIGYLPLSINSIILSGTNSTEFELSAGNTPIILNEGANINISAIFSPTTAGNKIANINIYHNAADSPNIVALTGIGEPLPPVLTLNRQLLDFENVFLGQTSLPHDFTITNTGGSPLIITNINMVGTNPNEFEITHPNLPITINGGDNIAVSALFTPETVGNKSAILDILHNAAGSPHNVFLEGIGVDPLPLPAINPEPVDGAVDVLLTQVLSWEADLSNAERMHAFPTGYKLYFGTTNPPPMIENNWTTTTYLPTGMSALQNGTTYYWQIIPFNETGDAVDCPVWSFTTIQAAEFTISPESFDFGEIIVEDISDSQIFTITNTGGSPLVIESITINEEVSRLLRVIASGGDFLGEPRNDDKSDLATTGDFILTANGLPWIINAGGNQTFTVTFSPTTIGNKLANLNIIHSASGSPHTSVNLSGVALGLPVFSIDPVSHDFGEIFVEAISDNKTFTITNIGGSPLVIESITIDEEVSRLLRGEFHRNDLATTGNFTFTANALPWTINAGENQTFTVAFSPSAPEGQKLANLIISHSASGSPHTSVTLTGVAVGLPVFSVNPVSYNFGDIVLGQSSHNQTFIITNSGGSPLVVESITINEEVSRLLRGEFHRSDLATTGNFILTANGLPWTINAGGNQSFTVSFSPSAPIGQKTANLSISHSLNDIYPHIVNLEGSGIPPVPLFATNPNPLNNAINIPLTQVLSWSQNTSGGEPTGYKIHFGTTNPPPLVVAELASVQTSWTPTPPLTYGTTYYWQVIPFNTTGDAVGNPVWSFTTIEAEGFNINPLSFNFGEIIVGAISDSQIFTITNTGGSPLTVNTITLAGVNQNEFNLVIHNLPWIINAGGNQTFNVSFSPTTIGSKTANLNITHSASGSPHTNTILTGTALGLPVFSINPTSHNFGEIIIGQTSPTQTFTISNTGGSPLTVTSITKAGTNQNDFNLVATGLPWTINAGGNQIFTVSFSPTAPAGNKAANLSIVHSASGSPHTSTNLSGIALGVAEFSINPTSHNFGEIIIGQTSSTQTFTISNTGGSPLTVTSIIKAGTNQNDFNVVANGLPWTINAGGNQTFTVSFSPTAPVGNKTANLSIVHSASGSPHTSTNLSGIALGVAEFSINPTSHNFGEIIVGAISDSQTFTITNSGGSPFLVSNITLSGTNQNEFNLITNGLPWTINAGGNQTFTVSFSPTTIGSKTANLNITHSASGSPHTINLSGMAVNPPPIFIINPTSHDFGEIFVGAISDSQIFTISNTGGSDLVIESITINEEVSRLLRGEFQGSDLATTGNFILTANGLPWTINAGGNQTFTVSFSPTTIGSKTANLNITHSASGSPHTNTILTGTALGLPVFSINPSSHDFGEIIVGTISDSQTFTITNTGGSPLTVNTITLAGVNQNEFILTANGLPWTINAGGNQTFTVSFSPTTIGSKTANLNITHSASSSPHTNTVLTGTALGLPVFSINPTSHDFGEIIVGAISDVQTFTITNTGGSPLVIESITINEEVSRLLRGEFQGSDLATTGNFILTANGLPWTVNAGGNQTFTVSFSPTSIGSKTANLNIAHSASGSPHTNTVLSGTALGLPVFSINPTSHYFGEIIVGTISDSQTFTITNTGGSPLVIESITINEEVSRLLRGEFQGSDLATTGERLLRVIASGGDFLGEPRNDDRSDLATTGNFILTANGLPWTINAGGNQTFTVSFSPTSIGSKTANLNIIHSASGSPHTNTILTGTALGLPVFSINPTSHNFGEIIVGDISDSQTFTISNTGGSPLVIESITINEEVSRLLRGEFQGSDLATTGNFILTANGLPWTINAGGNQTFTVSFSPTTIGSKTANLNITHSASGSPHTVNLYGMAVNPPPIFIINPTSHDFGEVFVEDISESQTFTITNTGGSDLVIESISLDEEVSRLLRGEFHRSDLAKTGERLLRGEFQGSDLAKTGERLLRGEFQGSDLAKTGDTDFILNHPSLPIIINSGNHVEINIAFAPQNIGYKEASLIFTHNVSSSPDEVGLSGLGVLPVFNPPRNLVISLSPSILMENDLLSTSGQAILTWLAPAAGSNGTLSSYRILRNGNVLGTVSSLSFTDNTIEIDKEYVYSVIAIYININGESEPVSESLIVPAHYPPQNLVATAGNAIVELSWDAPQTQQYGVLNTYKVYREDSTTENNRFMMVELPVNIRIFTDNSVQNGIEYTYHITANYINPVGESIPSNSQTVTPTVSEFEEIVPVFVTELHANQPNPFNPETVISFTLAVESIVSIDIYNIRGQKIKNLVNGFKDRGEHYVVWNGRDENGYEVGSGIYLYVMRNEDYFEVKRMVLLK